MGTSLSVAEKLIMKKRIRVLIAAVIVIFVALGVGIVGFGYFPVARVDGSTIYYRDVTSFVAAAENFKNLPGADPKIVEELEKGQDDAHRAVLEELIIQRLISLGADEFDPNEVEKKIQENLSQVLSGTDREQLEQAASRLYGMSFDDFTEAVVLPEIREIVIRQSVESRGETFDAWLEERMKNTAINIYFLPYRWNGTMLENK